MDQLQPRGQGDERAVSGLREAVQRRQFGELRSGYDSCSSGGAGLPGAISGPVLAAGDPPTGELTPLDVP